MRLPAPRARSLAKVSLETEKLLPTKSPQKKNKNSHKALAALEKYGDYKKKRIILQGNLYFYKLLANIFSNYYNIN